MIKKYAAYLGVLISGLILGYFIFGKEKVTERPTDLGDEKVVKWTCSMHPQVNKAEKEACPVCGMALVAIDKPSNSLKPEQFQMTENALALANIETMKVGVGSLADNSLTLTGKIATNQITNATQTTIFDGRIESLTINYVGEYVKKGQQIGIIYAPGMYEAQDRVLSSASYRQTHPKLWEAARKNHGLWKMTDDQIDQVIKTGVPVESFPLIAEVSGTVTEIVATEGKFYKEGDPLFNVSNLYTVWAVFDAYENQLPLLSKGQDIVITSKSFEGEKIEAKISFIEPILNLEKRTVSVRVTLKNTDKILKPGMFVEGTVSIDGVNQVLTVPKSAVLWTGKRSLVYIKPDENRPVFEMVEVTLGDEVGNSYVILDGLSSGEEVVVNGTFTVDAAAQLNGKKSMMSRIDYHNQEKGAINDGIQLKLNKDFNKKFDNIISAYINLKNALVDTDVNKSTESAKVLYSQFSDFQISTLNEEDRDNMNDVKHTALLIANSDDVETKRRHFKALSNSMIAITSQLDQLEKPIYVQFCPMADNNQGANWLSFENKIRNPYFGSKMLTCGNVIRTIK
ncbi:Cu(I)/Ag(I) efflux system membrane fusion protein [Flavobacteriaceae bacterium MAR_2009_75]|nr:Cu(I)/Ag(I) efflux system membrane fusion protein [Flavobacteriaceae bacterium MAR_2009_75]